MIRRESIEEVLMRTDITTLIGGYVSLKRAGTTLKGLCPFHSEKSPSFTVYPGDNSFYCFGCGKGGDAISFIKEIEHLDYPDAVEFLAKRAGITLLEDDNRLPMPGRVKFDKQKMLRMNVEAAKYFHRALFAKNEKAEAALAYFSEKRGLSLATIRHFGLGYAPDSFDEFINFMTARGYTRDELVAGFLAGRSESGRYYDAFRNRVMFPIIDVSGNVIAFGGRVMDDSKPKYKNSSDTPVFKKSRSLFALNFARLTCAESMILCEGYMDVIAMHAAGFTNAVATLGTAITAEQARVMSRYTKKVIISYDADEPGQKAAVRAMRMLGEVGLDCTVLKVPGAKDPDEYIRTYGKEKFRQILGQSRSIFEYSMDNILAKYDISLPQDKVKALHEVIALLATFRSKAEREIYIGIVAEKFGIDRRSITSDVERIIAKKLAEATRNEAQKFKAESQGYADRINPDYIKAPATAKHEETVLGLLLLYPEYRKKVLEEGLLTDADFFTAFNRRVFAYIREGYLPGTQTLPNPDGEFSSDEVGRMQRMKIERMNLSNSEETLMQSIASLKESVRRQQAKQTDTLEGLAALIAKKQSETSK